MITINVNKAKTIGHALRRANRAAEFSPLDEQIMKQIPGVNLLAVESERQAVRDKYAAMQQAIDVAQTPEQIKAALGLGVV